MCSGEADVLAITDLLARGEGRSVVEVDLVFPTWDTALDPPVDPTSGVTIVGSSVRRIDRPPIERHPDLLIIRVDGVLYGLSADRRMLRGGPCLGAQILPARGVDPEILAQATGPVPCDLWRIDGPSGRTIGETIGFALCRRDRRDEVIAMAIVETYAHQMPRRRVRAPMAEVKDAGDGPREVSRFWLDLAEYPGLIPLRVEIAGPDAPQPLWIDIEVDDEPCQMLFGGWGEGVTRAAGTASFGDARRSISIVVARDRPCLPLSVAAVLEDPFDPGTETARRVVLAGACEIHPEDPAACGGEEESKP